MEAKVQKMIQMTDEKDFFTLIERKLEEQGFEVLETLPPDKLSYERLSSDGTSRNGMKLIFANRSSNRFA